MWFLFQPSHERSRPLQSQIEILDTNEQQEAVARLSVIRAHQGRVAVGTPFVEAEQDGPIRVEDLTEIIESGSRFRKSKQ